jgi:serine/threonine protein kinase
MTSDALLGAEIGDFRLERRLGAGGMGVVYLAEDLALGRRVAVKLLSSHLVEDTQARTRFQREIDAAARIEHVSIVPVYAAGYDPASRQFYIAMRHIDGPDLWRYLKDTGPLSVERALPFLGQIGAALAAVHAAGTVHRDVKPQNILLWNPGEPDEHALLTDFGIARSIDDASQLTRGVPIGTPDFMAPEIWLGAPATPATDQYALACVAYWMLSGASPYDCAPNEQRAAHLEKAPRSLESHDIHVTATLRHALARGLAKSPEDRFPHMRDFVRTLGSGSAFDRSDAITRVIADPDPTRVVETLTEDFGLSDATVAQITEIDPSQIIRQRRLAARRRIVGEHRRA